MTNSTAEGQGAEAEPKLGCLNGETIHAIAQALVFIRNPDTATIMHGLMQSQAVSQKAATSTRPTFSVDHPNAMLYTFRDGTKWIASDSGMMDEIGFKEYEKGMHDEPEPAPELEVDATPMFLDDDEEPPVGDEGDPTPDNASGATSTTPDPATENDDDPKGIDPSL